MHRQHIEPWQISVSWDELSIVYILLILIFHHHYLTNHLLSGQFIFQDRHHLAISSYTALLRTLPHFLDLNDYLVIVEGSVDV